MFESIQKWCTEIEAEHIPYAPPPDKYWINFQPGESPDGPRCETCTASDPYESPTVYYPCLAVVTAQGYRQLISEYLTPDSGDADETLLLALDFITKAITKHPRMGLSNAG